MNDKNKELSKKQLSDRLKTWYEFWNSWYHLPSVKEGHKRAREQIRKLIEDKPIIDMTTWFYKNCKRQRKNEAKICQVCPFRTMIEEQEAEIEVGE